MSKFKKIVTLYIAMAAATGCLYITANAADNPECLYDNGVECCSKGTARGNTVPNWNSVIFLPDGIGSFTYNFSDYAKQYSDFFICPQTPTAGMRILFEATSDSHNLTLKVIRQGTNEVIYNDIISVVKGFEQEFWIPFSYFETGKGYYIELSNPSISEAAGRITITD